LPQASSRFGPQASARGSGFAIFRFGSDLAIVHSAIEFNNGIR
jgi:hypothetical protein